MNLNERSKLQEGSPERLDATYNLAKKKSAENPEISPITVELTNTAVAHCTLGGFDILNLTVKEVNDQGRRREQRELTIKDDNLFFTGHQAYEGLVAVVPATKHNLEVLASHAAEKRFFIHEEKWRDAVMEKAAALKPVRDVEKETSQPEFMPHVAAEEEKAKSLKEEIEKLEAKRRNLESLIQMKNQEAVAKPEAPQPVVEKDDDEEDDVVVETPVEEDRDIEPQPLGNIEEMVKKKVKEDHAEEIADMKARGIKWWLTSQCHKWKKEAQEALAVGV